MSKIRQVAGIESDESSYDYQHGLDQAGPSDFQELSNMQHFPSGVLPTMEPPVTRRVNVSQSPFLHAFYSHHPLRLTIDTGAETNMMRASLARHIGAKVTKSSQTALQADGRTPLAVVGETRLPLIRHGRPLTLEALVVEDLDVDILAGRPFMTSNDIAVRPAKREIIIAGCDVASYGCSQSPHTHYAVRACHLLRAPNTNTTVWPGEFIEIDAPSELLTDATLAIEPRIDSVSSSHLKPTHTWPQLDIVQSIGGKLRLLNSTEEPLLVRKNDQLCQARLTVLESTSEPSSTQAEPSPKFNAPLSSSVESVHVDPDGLLSPSERDAFVSLLKEFQLVFDSRIPGYNGAAGPIEGVVNMGPVEPPPSAKDVSLSTLVTSSICFKPNLTNLNPKACSVDPKI